MNDDKSKAAFERFSSKVEQYLKSLDAVDDGMMKAHEFVGHVEDRVSDVFDAARDGVMTLSEKLDAHRASVWHYLEKREKEVYGEPESHADGEPVVAEQDKSNVKTEKPTADMSHDEKVRYIIDGYGLPDSVEQRNVLDASSETALTSAVNILKRRNGLK